MATIENYGVRQAHEYPVPDDEDDEGKDESPPHPLDAPKYQKLKRKLLEWYNQEREKQAINRYQQAVDDDYYDNLQWADEDAQELKERGQAPLVFNEVKPVCDWIIGTERRTRIDYKVLPRADDDVQGAETKTKVLRYVNDVNMAPFHQSNAFAEAVRAGVGWLEEGIRTDPEEELLYVRRESWRNIVYDSNALEPDLSDGRYMIRWRWLDLDISQAAFPDRKEELRRAAVSSELFGPEQDEDLWYLGQRLQERDDVGNVIGRRTYISDASYVNNRRERVRLMEIWYKEPTTRRFLRADGFENVPFDESNAEMKAAVTSEGATLYDRLYLQMRVAIMTEDTLLLERESPYRHNKFPFTPIWAYRRKRDNAPYGVIRPSRDPQDDLNKRASKAQWILASNRVIYEKGAFEDPDEAREELSRPDAFVEKNAGKEVITENDRDIAETHLRIMEQDSARIRQTGGVTAENLGLQSNATSGKAILARQTQGTVNTTELFDNYRFALQVSGQKRLSLIEQFYTDAKVIRITGDNQAKPEFIKLNQIDPQTGEMVNDITASQADFIIGEQDYQQSVRMAMFETMLDMVSKMPPELAVKFLDLVFDLSDLPNKNEIVRRLRIVSGMVPPSDKNLTPEERRQVAQMRATQQKAQTLQETQIEATIEKLASEIDKLRAQALEIRQKAAAAGVGAQKEAVETASTITAMPDVAPVADEVLQSADFPDATPGG